RSFGALHENVLVVASDSQAERCALVDLGRHDAGIRRDGSPATALPDGTGAAAPLRGRARPARAAASVVSACLRGADRRTSVALSAGAARRTELVRRCRSAKAGFAFPGAR